MKGSLPLMLSMCHALGLLSSSDTEPWLSPSTNSPNSCSRENMIYWNTGHVYCKKWEY